MLQCYISPTFCHFDDKDIGALLLSCTSCIENLLTKRVVCRKIFNLSSRRCNCECHFAICIRLHLSTDAYALVILPSWAQIMACLLIGAKPLPEPMLEHFNWTLRNSEILIKIRTFSFKKMYLKTSSAKRRPFCLVLNVSNM